MERIKRNERMAALTKWLTDSPNQIFTLSQFCERFGSAKSTMSEDIDILRQVFETFELGRLETVTGAAGGVRYRPYLSQKASYDFVQELCGQLCVPSRVLPGGFLYLSDILSMHELVWKMGIIIAGQFYDAAPDFVLTMETKGIPVALDGEKLDGVAMIEKLNKLGGENGIGLVDMVENRSSKVYEGSAVNINYVSGSDHHIETMSLSRRAVNEGQRALIVDDFLKGGGTAKGMIDLMAEFDVEVVGTAFVMSTENPNQRCIRNEKALMTMNVTNDPASLTVRPAPWLRELAGEGAVCAEQEGTN